MFSSSETSNYQPHSSSPPLRLLVLSAPERRLLLALLWGESLLQTAQQMELSDGEAGQILSRLQQRAGVGSRQALIARAVAYRWTD